jgi:hypothetical protein
MPCPSHLLWLGNSNYTWRKVQVMKLHVMQLSPASYYFIPLRSEYSSQHCSQIPSVNVLPLMSETKFHIHTKLQGNYSFIYFTFYGFRENTKWSLFIIICLHFLRIHLQGQLALSFCRVQLLGPHKRGTTNIPFHSNLMTMEEGFSLSESRKPFSSL